MIPDSYFLAKNNSLPLIVTKETTPVSLFQPDEKLSHEDLIIQHLMNKAILGVNGDFNLGMIHSLSPYLNEPQINRLNELLTRVFLVKSPSNQFEFSMTLKELFNYLNIHTIEIVGGTVYWILGRDFMLECIKELEIENVVPADFFDEYDKPAADIDIRVPYIDEPEKWIEDICYFYQTKLPEKHWPFILAHGFFKYHNRFEEGDHFSIVSFGNLESFSVDLLFVKKLQRKNLFTSDNVIIEVSTDNKQKLEASTHEGPLMEALILRLTKTLSADAIDGIDFTGSCMLFTYLTKGWRFFSEELERKLLAKFINSNQFDLKKKIIHLNKAIKNHFPNDPSASSIFCFNVCYLLQQFETQRIFIAEFLSVSNECIEDLDHPLSIFQNMMQCLKTYKEDKIEINAAFLIVTAYFQIFGAVFNELKNTKTSQDVELKRTTIKNEPYLQFKFKSIKPLFIAVKDDLENALDNFEKNIELIDEEKKQSLFMYLERFTNCFSLTLSDVLKFSDVKPNVHTFNPDHLKVAFRLVQSKVIILNKMGFYLLNIFGVQEGTAKHLPLLFNKFVDLAIYEPLLNARQNIYYAFLFYYKSLQNHHIFLQALENFYQAIKNEYFDDVHRMWAFCHAFINVNDASSIKLVFDKWENHYELFDDKTHLALTEKLSKHCPIKALKSFQKILEKSNIPVLTLKPLFDTILDAYQNLNIQINSDFEEFANTANQLILQAESSNLKAEESKRYFSLIQQLLKANFSEAVNLIKTLEDKKMVKASFLRIIKQSSKDKAFLYALKLNEELPLEKTVANLQALELRLEAFLYCINDDLDDHAKALTSNEIIILLTTVFELKKSKSNAFKESIKPSLEWILINFLNSKNDVNIDSISFCFKLIEEIDLKIASKSQVGMSFVLALLKLLNSDSSLKLVEYIDTKLDILGLKNKKISNPNEVLLFQKLIKKALDHYSSDIAEFYLRKILSHYHPNKKDPTPFLQSSDRLMSLFLFDKNYHSAFNFLLYFEQLFPEFTSFNTVENYKKVLLNLKDENVKKAHFFLNKALFFSNDAEILLQVEKLVLELIKTCHPLKMRQDHFKLILDLTLKYSLSSKNIVEDLSVALTKLKDKEINKSAFLKLQSSNCKQHLLPFYKLLASQNPEMYTDFLDKIDDLLEPFHGNSILKRDFMFVLATGFLNLLKQKGADKNKILMAFMNLDYKIKSFKTDLQQQIAHDYKFINSFTQTVDPCVNIFTFEKFHNIASNIETVDQAKELFAALKNAIIYFEQNKIFDDSSSHYLRNSLLLIQEKINIVNFHEFSNILLPTNSDMILSICSNYVSNLIENASSIEQQNQLKSPNFKKGVKKLILQSFEIKYYIILYDLLSYEVFSKDEIDEILGKFSRNVFDDKIKMKIEAGIVDAIRVYLINIENPFENSTFQKANMESAIDGILDLIFVHEKIEIYYMMIAMICEKFICYMDNNEDFSSFLEVFKNLECSLPLSSIDANREVSVAEMVLMQEKFFSFLLMLTEKITKKFFDCNIELNHSFQNIANSNFYYLNNLIKMFPKKKNEITKAVLNYSYAITRLDPVHYYISYFNCMSLFSQMVKQQFFVPLDNMTMLENLFQLDMFTKSEVSTFVGLKPKYLAGLTLNVLKKIWHKDFLSTYAIVFEYLGIHGVLLKKEIPLEYKKFFDLFMKNLQLKFPGKDAIKMLASLIAERQLILHKRIKPE